MAWNTVTTNLQNFVKIMELKHRTVRLIPQHNGIIWRLIQTILKKIRLKKIRYLLSNSNLPKDFWTEAMQTTSYLINKSTSSSIEFKVPNQLWFGRPSGYKHLKVFGCVGCIHVNDEF